MFACLCVTKIAVVVKWGIAQKIKYPIYIYAISLKGFPEYCINVVGILKNQSLG